jgi:hypothetical protein
MMVCGFSSCFCFVLISFFPSTFLFSVVFTDVLFVCLVFSPFVSSFVFSGSNAVVVFVSSTSRL